MKKPAIIALSFVIATSLTGPASAAPTPKAGAKCSTVGVSQTVFKSQTVNKGQTFTCVTKKKKKQWSKAVDAYRIQTKLSVSQVWKGNKVELSILDSAGNNCALDANNVDGAECKGFYLGWRASFNDATRTIDYSQRETTTISDLVLGDNGEFQLMYQDNEASTPAVVKTFPFSYSY